MLESKQDMKSKGLDSPDRGDALVGCITCGGLSNSVAIRQRESIFELMEGQDGSDYGIPGMDAG
jgi:hypothetical protein